MPQPLNSKESNLFRTVIRNYEDKQYKRGLKAAEQILKKNPKHGDTMAMKALILNAQGKTEEAFALGKEALTVDMKSHVCWHVYGLLYRHNKNFEEAIKAYKFALRLEPESHQIQRDLAVLQIQMRDYQGYVQSRMAMLQARPQLRQNWTALAIAHHLAGNLAEAENVLVTYEETLKVPPSKLDLENSEAVLYKNVVIAEQGDIQRALDHLDSAARASMDRLAYLELRAKYLAQLDRKEEAAKAYRMLLDRNADNSEYYTGLIRSLGLEEAEQGSKKAVFDQYAEKYPRSDASRRLPLDFLSGDDFRDAARQYVTLMFDKGVPSVFANLKHLYADSFKMDTLASVVEDYLKSAQSPDQDKAVNGDSSKGLGAGLYYMAQHYNYFQSRDLDRAMEWVDKAIDLDNQNVAFHMTKARIWKHRGNLSKAAEIMDHARSLDTRDRYINSKAAKYQLRNNENERALQTMSLFTRGESPGGPLQDLLDMQCIWFLTEDGEAYARRGNVGMALKRFHAIFNIFEIWQEDQFDFHSFSLRKGQVRAYIDLVRWEDKLREHPFFSRAARAAVEVYLKLDDKAKPAANGVNGEAEANGEDAAERKRAAKKAKRDAQKAERAVAEKVAKQDPNKAVAATDATKKKDEDPLGLKLAATTEPLVEAMKFVNPLLQFSPDSIEAQVVGFEVYMRRKKYLLALRCLNAAIKLDTSHPRVHEQVVEFRLALASLEGSDAIPAKTAEVLKAEFTAVGANVDLSAYNEEYMAKHKNNPQQVLSAIKVRHLLGKDKNNCEKEILDMLSKQLGTMSLDDAAAGLGVLQAWKSSETEAYKAVAKSKWPEVTVLS